MRRRANPEGDAQRAIVATLRLVLPSHAIVHHSAHERRGGDKTARLAQAIGVGMGVHPGFSDLVVLSEGRVLFLEVKSRRGRQSEDQLRFAADVRAQGFGYEVVRSVDDALQALDRHGLRTRIIGRR